ncbi:MAG TPA: acyltransferase [Paenirhodobacter sp.]
MNRVPIDQGFEDYADRRHFVALDGLRFLSILAVLFHHSPLASVWPEYSRLFGRGYLGVDLFFVISGFLITTLLLRERDRTGHISLTGFYKRRALRILPLYLLVVTAVGGYYVLFKHEPGTAEKWPFYYLFLANFLQGDIPMLAPTWSLSVEEQYYMIWPLLLIALPRRWLLQGVVVFAVIYLLAVHTGLAFYAYDIGPLSFNIYGMTYVAILLGAGLALLLHRANSFTRLWRWLGWQWASPLLFAVLLVELLTLPVDLRGWPNLIIHLTMAALLGSLVIREDTPLIPILTFAPIVRIGTISYGIYLLHNLSLHAANMITGRMGGSEANMPLFLLLFWGGAVLLAEISFRFYEGPFLALRHKKLGQLGLAVKSKSNKESRTP